MCDFIFQSVELGLAILFYALLFFPLCSVLLEHFWRDLDRNGVFHKSISTIDLLVDASSRAKEAIFKDGISRWSFVNVHVKQSLLEECCQCRHVLHTQQCFSVLLHEHNTELQDRRFKTLAEYEIINTQDEL